MGRLYQKAQKNIHEGAQSIEAAKAISTALNCPSLPARKVKESKTIGPPLLQALSSEETTKECASFHTRSVEESKKREKPFPEVISSEKTRQQKAKNLSFPQENIMAPAIAMRGDMDFSDSALATLILMKQQSKRLCYKNLMFKYKETRKLQVDRVGATDVEE